MKKNTITLSKQDLISAAEKSHLSRVQLENLWEALQHQRQNHPTSIMLVLCFLGTFVTALSLALFLGGRAALFSKGIFLFLSFVYAIGFYVVLTSTHLTVFF
jgi:hypothetical protein